VAEPIPGYIFGRCCQCGAEGEMRGRRGADGAEHVLPPEGWLEVFLNPYAFPRDEQIHARMLRVCPRCNVPNRPGRTDLMPRARGRD